jgi:hypothetical protein
MGCAQNWDCAQEDTPSKAAGPEGSRLSSRDNSTSEHTIMNNPLSFDSVSFVISPNTIGISMQ